MVKSQGHHQDHLPPRVVPVGLLLDLTLVDMDLTLVKATLVGLEDPIHHMEVHLLKLDILMDQADLVVLLAVLLVVREALPTIPVQEDHLHMEDLMVQVQVPTDLHLTEQWVDIQVPEDHPCLEAQEVLLLVPLEVHHHQDLLVPQVGQAQAHTVAQLQTYRNCRTRSTRWKREA